MVLQDYKIDGEYICISKKELEKWRDHYLKLYREQDEEWKRAFYLGKADAMIEALKMFEPLMG